MKKLNLENFQMYVLNNIQMINCKGAGTPIIIDPKKTPPAPDYPGDGNLNGGDQSGDPVGGDPIVIVYSGSIVKP